MKWKQTNKKYRQPDLKTKKTIHNDLKQKKILKLNVKYIKILIQSAFIGGIKAYLRV